MYLTHIYSQTENTITIISTASLNNMYEKLETVFIKRQISMRNQAINNINPNALAYTRVPRNRFGLILLKYYLQMYF